MAVIKEFFAAKVLFVTGASGFIGKVLVEKLLREQPDVARMYILVRPKEGQSLQQRFEKEFLKSEIFAEIKRIHGDEFESFMATKLVPVPGELGLPALGIPADIMAKLYEEVQVVLHLAASANFRLPIDEAIKENTLGAREVAKLAASCPKLESYVHYSTSFAHGNRQGEMPEVQLRWSRFEEGYKRFSQDILAKCAPHVAELIQEPLSSYEEEVAWALSMPERAEQYVSKTQPKLTGSEKKRAIKRVLKDLALNRARFYGQQDGYSYSKAMAEMAVQDYSLEHNLPLVILRPAIVGTVATGPNRGWVEFIAETSPFVMGYVNGEIDGFLINPNVPLDLVPCCHVINATLAAAAVHANQRGECHVYQVSSSAANPLPREVQQSCITAFGRLHYPGRSLPDFINHSTAESYMNMVRSRYPSRITAFNKMCAAVSSKAKKEITEQYTKYRILEYLAIVYSAYLLNDCVFSASNTASLFAQLSPEDQQAFDFDIAALDWPEYMMGAHFAGVCRHLNGDKHIVIQPQGYTLVTPKAEDNITKSGGSGLQWAMGLPASLLQSDTVRAVWMAVTGSVVTMAAVAAVALQQGILSGPDGMCM